MVCIFVEPRSTRSVKVAKRPKTVQKRLKLVTRKPEVVKKAKPQVKKSVGQSVAPETVPRMYGDQPCCIQYVSQAWVGN